MKTRLTPFGPSDELAKLAGQASRAIYGKNQRIFAQGESASDIFYIREGAVKLSVISAEGKEAVVALLGPDNFFGEVCLLTSHPLRVVTATAMTKCTVLRFEMRIISSLLRDDAEFRETFLHYLLARNQRVEEDLADQILNSSEKRLARLLLRLSHLENGGKVAAATVNITQELLAQMIGATRPRVSYLMNKFKKQGLIEYRKGLRVNRSLLAALLNEEEKFSVISNE
jgi:CRP/FNR family cyclic AMP-dependent transcriptional regulator